MRRILQRMRDEIILTGKVIGVCVFICVAVVAFLLAYNVLRHNKKAIRTIAKFLDYIAA